jgi:hypothetical protein
MEEMQCSGRKAICFIRVSKKYKIALANFSLRPDIQSIRTQFCRL